MCGWEGKAFGLEWDEMGWVDRGGSELEIQMFGNWLI
jgi:hypothetical protein